MSAQEREAVAKRVEITVLEEHLLRLSEGSKGVVPDMDTMQVYTSQICHVAETLADIRLTQVHEIACAECGK